MTENSNILVEAVAWACQDLIEHHLRYFRMASLVGIVTPRQLDHLDNVLERFEESLLKLLEWDLVHSRNQARPNRNL